MAKTYLTGDVVMGSKDLSNINNYADLHLQSIRNIEIVVEVLDKDLNALETIEGMATGGSINVSNSSLLRRTGSLSFTLFDYLMPQKESLLWMTNRIRVYAGIKNLSASEGTMTYFCLGTFYITEPSVAVNADSREVSITLEDNMMRWETHEIDTQLVIEAETPLHSAMALTMNYFGEWNLDIEFTDLTVPYKLEFPVGTNVMSIVEALRNLYMDWDCYYDIDGTFVFKKMHIQREDGEPVAWRFVGDTNHMTSHSEAFTYKNVKNKITVIGSMDEITGLTPKAEASIINSESPFHESEIGVRRKVISDTSLSTVQQCDSKARYELFKQSTFQEQLTMGTLPIYFLDGNDIIEVENPTTKEVYKYIIDTIGISLDLGGDMSISAHKLYYDHFDVGSTLDEYRETADIVINGITNKGWLSIPEQRILDYFGIYGSGNKVIVRFEEGMLFGTTAYVTGYTGGETTQTITVDLADFKSYGDSGDTGHSKSEYSDRILGHEVLHLIMNDYFSVDKTIDMQTWFKEGLGEFVHGADERLKTSIVESGSINNEKLDKIISNAVDMLNNNSWLGDSDTYSASYLIIKYIDKHIVDGKDWKDIMKSIRDSNKESTTSVKDAIVSNTSFSSFADFINSFSTNGSMFVKTSVNLNYIGDEADTGSIGGSDHRGDNPLNAEDVFDNSKAVKGIVLKNFEVEFDRP